MEPSQWQDDMLDCKLWCSQQGGKRLICQCAPTIPTATPTEGQRHPSLAAGTNVVGGVVTSSEVTTESDTPAEPDLVSFCATLGNNRALRVPTLFKPDGDYQTVADMVGGSHSITESTTSHEESLDEARSASSHRRSRGQELQARQGHRPSHGDPDYSYAHPCEEAVPSPTPPLSSTDSNRCMSEVFVVSRVMPSPVLNMERAARRHHTLEFSEEECDHPSIKQVGSGLALVPVLHRHPDQLSPGSTGSAT
ncbi:hypothetical protein O3P69_019903 [Scylla paramamosain]|uniref:Uncharacterized protein n=1 Tax=Scylla paramamosain TaxID=85552 RepID=A0AAW0SFB2_SCYPA